MSESEGMQDVRVGCVSACMGNKTVRNSTYSYNLAATIHLAEVTTLSHYSPATTLLCLA